MCFIAGCFNLNHVRVVIGLNGGRFFLNLNGFRTACHPDFSCVQPLAEMRQFNRVLSWFLQFEGKIVKIGAIHGGDQRLLSDRFNARIARGDVEFVAHHIRIKTHRNGQRLTRHDRCLENSEGAGEDFLFEQFIRDVESAGR